jgi:hypothetical protein
LFLEAIISEDKPKGSWKLDESCELKVWKVKDLIRAKHRLISVETMSENAERMKRLLTFKKKIETRIEELDVELKDLEATLETVNSILLEKGFRRPDIGIEPPTTTVASTEEPESVVSEMGAKTEEEPREVAVLKSDTGEVLADLYVDADESLHVVLAKNKNFDVNTPPFNQFLIQRVLLKMQERDSELVRSGQLTPEAILCFDIRREGDVVRELIIRNFDGDRLKELKSSIRWTLEKMFEKMKGQN